jgi:hypothetical protein
MPKIGAAQIQFLEASANPVSPQEGWAVDANRAKRYFYLPGNPKAARRQQAAEVLLGYPQVLEQKTADGTRTMRYISRELPNAYPFENNKGEPYLFATSIEQTTGLGVGRLDDLDLTAYDMALYEVNYSSLPYDIRTDAYVQATEFWGNTAATNPLYDSSANPPRGYPDEGGQLSFTGWTNTRFVSRQMKKGARFMTLPMGLLMYTDANPNAKNVIPWGFPVTQPYAEVRYVWHQVPRDAYPARAINNAFGSVNNGQFDTFSQGTLLFKDIDVASQRSAAGDRILNIQYSFVYLPNYSKSQNPAGQNEGHNAILRSYVDATGKRVIDYWPVTSDGSVDGATPYRYTDFATLFRPDQP